MVVKILSGQVPQLLGYVFEALQGRSALPVYQGYHLQAFLGQLLCLLLAPCLRCAHCVSFAHLCEQARGCQDLPFIYPVLQLLRMSQG